MPSFWVSLEARLENPLELLSDDGRTLRARLIGFVQELGCTARDEEALRRIVDAHVRASAPAEAGAVDLTWTKIVNVAPEDIEADEGLRSKIMKPLRAEGVWFETARSFYSQDGE